jgi:tryptophan-rich sensory protein
MSLTWALAVFLLANFAAALSGGYFRPGAWYEGLRKPRWQPPDWAFPVVWSVLYVLNAYAGWRVWESAGPGEAFVPMAVYGLQLVLNAGWSAIFFGLHRMGLAMVEVLLLWLSILGCMIAFHPLDALAAWLLLPYLAWVTVASCLNWTVWRMNRQPA